MNKVFSKKEILHESIEQIRLLHSIHYDRHSVYYEFESQGIILFLFRLDIINHDKWNMLNRIIFNMFS